MLVILIVLLILLGCKEKLCNYWYSLVVCIIIFNFKIYCITVVGIICYFIVSGTISEGNVLACFCVVLRDVGIVFI